MFYEYDIYIRKFSIPFCVAPIRWSLVAFSCLRKIQRLLKLLLRLLLPNTKSSNILSNNILFVLKKERMKTDLNDLHRQQNPKRLNPRELYF